MENNSYFTYFSEIEDRFCQRRGTILILSTLDWALIETWKDAGIPLEAVLRGIDDAFDKYDARPRKTQKINSLAYCSQAVLAAAEDLKAAAEGAARPESTETGFEGPNVGAYLIANADKLEALLSGSGLESTAELRLCGDGSVPRSGTGRRPVPGQSAIPNLPPSVATLVQETARNLRDLAAGLPTTRTSLEDLERRLTVMEDKLFAALLASTPDEQLITVRAEADRELTPYRRKMSGPQIEQLHKQYVHKRLLERYSIPRLSLFYMQ